MGILLLNIVVFALPAAAYFNPRAYGGWHGADLATYLINFILFDGKMRALFAMLFGASLLLIVDRATAQGRSAVRIHFARMLWLLCIGLAHFYLLWEGDILALYALLGMIAFTARTLVLSRLVTLAIMLIILNGAIIALLPFQIISVNASVADPTQAASNARDLASLQGIFGVPSAAQIAKDLSGHLGSWQNGVAYRIETISGGPIASLLVFGAEILGLMLLGMAGLKSGMLTGEWTRARYQRWWLWSSALSIPGYIALTIWMVSTKFSLFSVASAFSISFWLQPIMAVGWACLLILSMPHLGRFAARITAAGRMALSNYILTSVICTSLFFGQGLGWFGTLSRWQLYPIVALVWALMLLWSEPWLARFRFGPAEWLWRSLSRGKLEQLRIRP